MKYHLIDYKGGKYYMIADKIDDDGFDFSVGTITDEKLTDNFLREHVDACRYYGIPPYIGRNKELTDRIEKLQDEYDKNYEK